MQTPPEIVFEGIAATPAIEDTITAHIADLEQRWGRANACRVVIKGPSVHHRQGGLYEVHIRLVLPEGREVNVGRTARLDERRADLNFALNDAFKRARRQLQLQLKRARGRREWAAVAQAVVKVGDGGRGFTVETEHFNRISRVIITAAHCLRPSLPPAHPWSYTEARTYPRLLGPLGKAKPTVWGECLFADPLADIAVLGSPDNQALGDEANAYDELMDGIARPFAVADAPGIKRDIVKLPHPSAKFSEPFEIATPGRAVTLVLSLDGTWIECAMERRGSWLWVEQDEIFEGGMSGSPILSPVGQAIGVVSTGTLNPILLEALPPRIGLRRT